MQLYGKKPHFPSLSQFDQGCIKTPSRCDASQALMRIWAPVAQVTFGLVHRLCDCPGPAAIHAHSSPHCSLGAWLPGGAQRGHPPAQQLPNRHNLIYAGRHTHKHTCSLKFILSLFSKDWGDFTHTTQSLRMLLLLLSHFSRVRLCATP